MVTCWGTRHVHGQAFIIFKNTAWWRVEECSMVTCWRMTAVTDVTCWRVSCHFDMRVRHFVHFDIWQMSRVIMYAISWRMSLCLSLVVSCTHEYAIWKDTITLSLVVSRDDYALSSGALHTWMRHMTCECSHIVWRMNGGASHMDQTSSHLNWRLITYEQCCMTHWWCCSSHEWFLMTQEWCLTRPTHSSNTLLTCVLDEMPHSSNTHV